MTYVILVIQKFFKSHLLQSIFVLHPRTPKVVSAEKLYKNDGNSFEDNWQERVIERYTPLLYMCTVK